MRGGAGTGQNQQDQRQPNQTQGNAGAQRTVHDHIQDHGVKSTLPRAPHQEASAQGDPREGQHSGGHGAECGKLREATQLKRWQTAQGNGAQNAACRREGRGIDQRF